MGGTGAEELEKTRKIRVKKDAENLRRVLLSLHDREGTYGRKVSPYL